MKQIPQFLYFSYILLFLLISTIKSSGQSNVGEIYGTVRDLKNNGLFNVNVVISGTNLGASSDQNGIYNIKKIPAGSYTITFMYIGYRTQIRDDIIVSADETTQLNIVMEEDVIQLQEIIVTPGNFAVSRDQTTRRQVIRKERITSLPATLDDIYRVIQIMPGVAFSDDFSAHFHVRGGEQDENLILLDGVEIFDPYHLKNIGGAVGVMNMDLIEDVTIITGGFPVKYGDKLSSVVVIENRDGNNQNFSGSIGVGGTGINMVLEGPFPSGSCVFSYRKSFLKEAVDILNPTDYSFSPSFYDLQGKIVARLNNNNKLIINALYSKDNSYLEKWYGETDLFSDYGNGYYGLAWQRIHSKKLFSEFILSTGENFWDNTIGGYQKEKLSLTENVLSWNLNYQRNHNHEISLGITSKQIHYNYEFKIDTLSQNHEDDDEHALYTENININPQTFKIGTYLQNKYRIFQPLVANIGIRYDYFEYNQDDQWSPRIGLAYTLRDNTILRTSWGYYYQAPVYTELTGTKGKTGNPKAEKAVHYIFAAEHHFTPTFNARVEAYIKKLSRMIGYYYEARDWPENPVRRYGNPFQGYARGVEVFLNGEISPQLSLWVSYAYSKNRIEASIINWHDKTVAKNMIPRCTDQPQNLSFFMNYNLPKKWKLNIKWRYLSGSPYTPYIPVFNSMNLPEWNQGEINSAHYPDYHRLDLRIGKKFAIKNISLAAFLEMKNVYNRKNVITYNYEIENGKHRRTAYYSLPLLPSLEFNVTF